MTLKHTKDLRSKQAEKQPAKPMPYTKAEKSHMKEAKPPGKTLKHVDKTKVPGKKTGALKNANSIKAKKKDC